MRNGTYMTFDNPAAFHEIAQSDYRLFHSGKVRGKGKRLRWNIETGN